MSDLSLSLCLDSVVSLNLFIWDVFDCWYHPEFTNHVLCNTVSISPQLVRVTITLT